jgi:hypothetical protein
MTPTFTPQRSPSIPSEFRQWANFHVTAFPEPVSTARNKATRGI